MRSGATACQVVGRNVPRLALVGPVLGEEPVGLVATTRMAASWPTVRHRCWPSSKHAAAARPVGGRCRDRSTTSSALTRRNGVGTVGDPARRWRRGSPPTLSGICFTCSSIDGMPVGKVRRASPCPGPRCVTTAAGFGRAHDRAALVDPHRHGHVRRTRRARRHVGGVDQRRVGRGGRLDPERTGEVWVDVEGDGDDRETLRSARRAVACHPGRRHGNLTNWPRPRAAPCARGAPTAERVAVAVFEIRSGSGRARRARGRVDSRPECPEPVVLVVHQRHREAVGDDRRRRGGRRRRWRRAPARTCRPCTAPRAWRSIRCGRQRRRDRPSTR